jgi:uncharacterized membrane protein YeaQ/YmgE (transglycosylase-associated protein family)
MDPLVWIVVGLGVGLLAALLARGGDGPLGDLLFGLLGAFLGGWLVDPLYVGAPPHSLPGSWLAALLAAAAFVGAFRLVHRTSANPA